MVNLFSGKENLSLFLIFDMILPIMALDVINATQIVETSHRPHLTSLFQKLRCSNTSGQVF